MLVELPNRGAVDVVVRDDPYWLAGAVHERRDPRLAVRGSPLGSSSAGRPRTKTAAEIHEGECREVDVDSVLPFVSSVLGSRRLLGEVETIDGHVVG